MQLNKAHMRIPVRNGECIHAMVIRPQNAHDLAAGIVFSHGFTVDGTESGRHFLSLAEELCAVGFSAMLFDYRGSGYSDMLFENMTFGSEVEDLGAAIDYARREFAGEIGVWGESFGCAVAARTLAFRSDVAATVLWSLSADLYERYWKRYGNEAEVNGFSYSANGFKVTNRFLASLKDEDTFSAIRDMGIPALLVHGTADEIASVELPRKAHAMAPENTELYEVDGGNHGFEAQPTQFELAKKFSLEWVRRRMSIDITTAS